MILKEFEIIIIKEQTQDPINPSLLFPFFFCLLGVVALFCLFIGSFILLFLFSIWLVFVCLFLSSFNCLVFFSPLDGVSGLAFSHCAWAGRIPVLWSALLVFLLRCCYDKFWKFLIALWYLFWAAFHIDWCFGWIVSARISFYIRVLGFCFDCMWFVAFKRCTFVFITALLLRGILYDFSYTCMARCLIFPFFFLSASFILLSFVTIYCFGCALSNKKLQCGRVVMFLAF